MNLTNLFALMVICMIGVNVVVLADIVNSKVDRVIDISSQVVRITSRIHIDNTGNAGANAVDSYLFSFDANHRNQLSYVSATIDKRAVQAIRVDDNVWRLDLSSVGAQLSNAVIELDAYFTHLLVPHPSQILQSESQFVLYEGNHYFLSPYQTKTQTTKVRLPSSGTIESYSKLKPVSQTDRTITYGPYENIAPNSYNQMKLHVENNSPFLTVTKLLRSIEVSHWAGIVSVEETIDVKHTGAVLKGPFSRFEYQREPNNGISSIKSWRTKLSSYARDIYYRDEIGNISTSNVRPSMNNVVVELRPRFPLFGGWKTHYVLGYYVPSQDVLFNEGNEFALKIPFVDHIFDNNVIDEATVKVILPEGASDIKLRLPYSVTREHNQVHYSFLDTVGRPVIVLLKSNLVEAHIQNFEVHYTYHKIFLLQEPLLVVGALFALCIAVIIYVRLDFSISKNPQKQNVAKVATIIENIVKHHEKRASGYEQFDKSASKFKSNKDLTAYRTTQTRLNNEHKQETQAITEFISKLKQEGASSDVLEKVNELQRQDRALKEQISQQVMLAEKLVNGKVTKQVYMENETSINKKKEEAVNKILTIVKSF